MIALDTNLLIYAHRTAVPEHRAAQRAIERAMADPRGCGIALFTIAEFWSVVTHPAAKGRASTPIEASDFLRELREGDVPVWLPGAAFDERLAQLASDLHVNGVRIFDLQIALTVFDNGANEMWTHDARFQAIPGLRVIDPLETQ